MRHTLPLLALLLLLSACHRQQQPSDVLPQETMVDFLCDAYLLEGYYAIATQYRYDVVPADLTPGYDSILALHGLTREQVERSLDYYTAHLDIYRQMHDSVAARLEAELEAARQQSGPDEVQ